MSETSGVMGDESQSKQGLRGFQTTKLHGCHVLKNNNLPVLQKVSAFDG